jgi:hypothetical protein
MPEQTLVMSEVQEELSYLFDAPALAHVRGAAAMLETLARFMLPSLARSREFGGAGIIMGGRHYVATFSGAEVAQRFAEEGRRAYRQRSAGLALRYAHADVQTDDLVTNFGSRLGQVRQRLEREPTGAPAAAAAYRPELRWCDACHRYPAVRVSAGDVLCRACVNRRLHDADQDSRLHVPGYQSGLADAGDEDMQGRPVRERLLRWLRDSGILRTADAAGDIADLAHRRSPDERVLADTDGNRAVMWAEINDFLWLLEQSHDSQRALRTSARVNRLLDEAFFEAVTSVVWRDRDLPFNFDILLSGGSRVVCLLPADIAIPVTTRALRTFESQSSAATDGRRLGISAGVGLAPATLSWSATAFQAQLAMAAARRADRAATPLSQRGSWRSVVALASPADDLPAPAGIGELERATAHARTLRRAGLAAEHLQPAVPALRGGLQGPLALLTSGWTDPQRRALVAVARDLSLGSAEAASADAVQLWPVVVSLLPWTSANAVAPPPLRSRPAPEPTAAERSA